MSEFSDYLEEVAARYGGTVTVSDQLDGYFIRRGHDYVFMSERVWYQLRNHGRTRTAAIDEQAELILGPPPVPASRRRVDPFRGPDRRKRRKWTRPRVHAPERAYWDGALWDSFKHGRFCTPRAWL